MKTGEGGGGASWEVLLLMVCLNSAIAIGNKGTDHYGCDEGWVGLGWVGLGWVRLGWVRLGKVGLGKKKGGVGEVKGRGWGRRRRGYRLWGVR